jgi:hypothetical protein
MGAPSHRPRRRQAQESNQLLAKKFLLPRSAGFQTQEESVMLYTIAVVLIVLWLLGLVTAYTMGGFIHILLVVAVVVVLLRIISGRKPI